MSQQYLLRTDMGYTYGLIMREKMENADGFDQKGNWKDFEEHYRYDLATTQH